MPAQSEENHLHATARNVWRLYKGSTAFLHSPFRWWEHENKQQEGTDDEERVRHAIVLLEIDIVFAHKFAMIGVNLNHLVFASMLSSTSLSAAWAHSSTQHLTLLSVQNVSSRQPSLLETMQRTQKKKWQSGPTIFPETKPLSTRQHKSCFWSSLSI